MEVVRHYDGPDRTGTELTVFLTADDMLGILKYGSFQEEFPEDNGGIWTNNRCCVVCPLTKVETMRIRHALMQRHG